MALIRGGRVKDLPGVRYRDGARLARLRGHRQAPQVALLDWSYALLGETERELFTRLCVFEAGSRCPPPRPSTPAGSAVDAGSCSALSSTSRWRWPRRAPSGTSCSRRCAGTGWSGSTSGDAARRAHLGWFVGFAAAAEAGLLSGEYRLWRGRLEQELPNLRAACGFAVASGTPDYALRIVGALWWFWGHGLAPRGAPVARGGPAASSRIEPAARARALTVLGYLAGQQLDLGVARAAGEESLALSLALGDEQTVAMARQALGLTLEACGEHDRSASLLAQARLVWDAAGSHHHVATNDVVSAVRALAVGDLQQLDTASREVLRRSALIGFDPLRCWGHLLRARLAETRHDVATAAAECAKAVAVARRLDLAHNLSFALTQSGRVAARDGDLDGAEAAVTEAVAVAEGVGAGWFVALARVGLADVRRARGDVAGARALLAQVLADGGGPTPGTGRVTFFRRLAGDPVVLAAAGLETAG